MSKTRFFGTAALLSVLIASPASAQHMIDEPLRGTFAYVVGAWWMSGVAMQIGAGMAGRFCITVV